MIIFASLEGPPVSLFELESSTKHKHESVKTIEGQPTSSTAEIGMVDDIMMEKPESATISIQMTPNSPNASINNNNPLNVSNAILILLFVTITTQVVKRTTFKNSKTNKQQRRKD